MQSKNSLAITCLHQRTHPIPVPETHNIARMAQNKRPRVAASTSGRATSPLELLDQRLDAFDGRSGPSSLGDQDFALLVDGKDAALGALGLLLEADGGD